MVYGAIYSAQESLPAVDVRLTYYQIDTDRILRFVRHFSRQELEQFLHKLLHRYLPGHSVSCMAGNPQRQPDRHAVPV